MQILVSNIARSKRGKIKDAVEDAFKKKPIVTTKRGDPNNLVVYAAVTDGPTDTNRRADITATIKNVFEKFGYRFSAVIHYDKTAPTDTTTVTPSQTSGGWGSSPRTNRPRVGFGNP